jgi:hypothetical protein
MHSLSPPSPFHFTAASPWLRLIDSDYGRGWVKGFLFETKHGIFT